MKRSWLVLLIVSLLVLTGCAQWLTGAQGIEILTHSGHKYTPSLVGSPTVHIAGEVQNVGTSNLEYVKLDATFYDSENKAIRRDPDWAWSDQVWIDVLLPGEKAPFEFIIIGLVEEYKSYTLAVDEVRQTTQQPYRDFEWLDHSSSLGEDEWYYVNGSIKNTGTQDVRLLTILVTFYNAEGRVIWFGISQLREGLGAGETASFEASAAHYIAPQIESYSLRTDALL